MVDFKAFGRFYNETSRVDNYNKYKQEFFNAYNRTLREQGFNSPILASPNAVLKNITPICTKIRTYMLSAGVPAASTKQLLDKFKLWMKSFYG